MSPMRTFPELWQLVDAVFAQPAANRSHAESFSDDRDGPMASASVRMVRNFIILRACGFCLCAPGGRMPDRAMSFSRRLLPLQQWRQRQQRQCGHSYVGQTFQIVCAGERLVLNMFISGSGRTLLMRRGEPGRICAVGVTSTGSPKLYMLGSVLCPAHGYFGVEKHQRHGLHISGSKAARSPYFGWYAEFFRSCALGPVVLKATIRRPVVVRGCHKPFQLLWVGGEIAVMTAGSRPLPGLLCGLPGNIYYAPCYGRCRQHYKEHGYQLVIGHAFGNVIVQKGGEEIPRVPTIETVSMVSVWSSREVGWKSFRFVVAAMAYIATITSGTMNCPASTIVDRTSG